MKALTVCQPYAELIARGVKPIENRTWPTRYRGYLAIHAGKSRQWLDDGDEDRYPGMAYGAIVCVVRLIACLHMDAEWPERIAHLKLHEHANGPWCWVFARHVIRCEPILARGAQGLWEWEQAVSSAERLTPLESGPSLVSAPADLSPPPREGA